MSPKNAEQIRVFYEQGVTAERAAFILGIPLVAVREQYKFVLGLKLDATDIPATKMKRPPAELGLAKQSFEQSSRYLENQKNVNS